MKICGVIVEYNPFHNGHIKHLTAAREITGADVVVAVTSGNYTQRGELSVIDKFTKTEAALTYGADLVLELPYAYATQSATVFADKAVSLLKLIAADYLVFGSESNNLEELKEIASLAINPDHLKEILKSGASYPKAYGLLAGAFYPNDILAIAYLKALRGSKIIPYAIQRTSDFNSLTISDNTSAKAIRRALKNNEPYQSATPLKIEHPLFLSDLYPFIQRLLLTLPRSELKEIQLVDEGIEKLLIDNAVEFGDFEDFITHSVSRRYTRSRIQRIILQIANHIRKEDIASLPPLDFIKPLGFNKKGQELLKELKKNELKIAVKFKEIPLAYRVMEYKVSSIYASLLEPNERAILMKKEIAGPLIINH